MDSPNDTLKNVILYTAWKDDENKTQAGFEFMQSILKQIFEEDLYTIPDLYVNTAQHSQVTVRNTPCHLVAGWYIDTRALKFHKIPAQVWNKLVHDEARVINTFDELEAYCESIKHRFSTKKFGL